MWDNRHGKILLNIISKFKENEIRYFVLRGYVGLPNHNPSKDVDILIENGKIDLAQNLLKQAYNEAGVQFFYPSVFGHAHCYLGMSINKKFSIHIDLIEGYISKGFEVFTFDELYEHVIDYKGMNVLDDLMNGVMLLVYKIFGYRHAKLKPVYQDDIFIAQQKYPQEFERILIRITGDGLGQKLCSLIRSKNFDDVIALESEFTRALKKYTFHVRPGKTILYTLEFLWQKVERIVFRYKKYAKTFAVIAPDGTGKTTFLDRLLKELNFYYVNEVDDQRFHVYHFRPSLLPNLGAVGEKAGVMKQDTDFTNPHRSKPANPLSSLIRIAYYAFDYIVGWQKCVRNDVHYDRYTIFDRYSYDFLVDPLRTKLNLPRSVRNFFVALTPQPDIVFYLDADPNIIYIRKQELSLDEIKRQIGEYRKLVKTNSKRFVTINAEQTPEEMAQEAITYLLNRYTEKI